MRIFLTVTTAALALTACGPKAADTNANVDVTAAGDNMSPPDAMMADNGMSAAALTAPDFAKKAAMSDMYEIASSKLAVTMATDPAIKKFAQQMVDGHTATTRALKAAIAKDNVIMLPATALDAEHQALVDALKAAKGANFDTLYKTQQTDVHTKTLATLEGYASAGDKPAVKAFAAETAPKVKSHLDMVKSMS